MDKDSPNMLNVVLGGVESTPSGLKDLKGLLEQTQEEQDPSKYLALANMQTTLLEPPPMAEAQEICSFETDAEVSVEKGKLVEENLRSKFFSLLDSGSTAKKAANDLKVDKRLSGITLHQPFSMC